MGTPVKQSVRLMVRALQLFAKKKSPENPCLLAILPLFSPLWRIMFILFEFYVQIKDT